MIPRWINIIGILLILDSASWFFSGYVYYSVYQQAFGHLSQNQILVRYLLSVLGRIVGLVAGIGILGRVNFCRRLGILLCAVTILTLYWKHPAPVVEKAAGRLAAYGIDAERRGPGAAAIAEFSLWTLYAKDFVFSAAFIVFFTRPPVVRHFRPPGSG